MRRGPIDRSTYEIALAPAEARAEQVAREKEGLSSLVAAKAIGQKESDDATPSHTIAPANPRQAQLNLSGTTVTAPVSGGGSR